MKIAYIIDLDGTLYDNSHRQHLIPADRSNTAGWVEFNCACADDVLREDMSDLVRSVLLSGREVIFLTGRGEAAGEQTMQRLLKDFNFIEQPTLIMRPMDCHSSAAEFKRDAVKRIRDSKRWADYQLIALEDDPSIVEVMRGMGVTVLHIDSKCCTVEKPHHNGMMQLSNELADTKAALRRLAAYARAHAGDIEYTGDHPIAVADKLAGRDDVLFYGCSATDKAPAQPFGKVKLYGNTEQLDTAPAQFESLAGEHVTLTHEGENHTEDKLDMVDHSGGATEKVNSPVIPDSWVACSDRFPDPDSAFRVCAYTPTLHEDFRFRSVPASLFKSVCRDATHWQYILPPAAPQQEDKS